MSHMPGMGEAPAAPVRDERGRPVRFVVRPGKEPTRDTPEGGRVWHYLTPDGVRLEYPAGSEGRREGLAGWRGEVDLWLSNVPPPRTRPCVEAWAEHVLRLRGVEVVSAEEAAQRAEAMGADWWMRALPAGP